MIAIGFAGVWAFYSVATWGWVLVKGYNITLREWLSPVHVYQWPAGDPNFVPQGHLFPVSGTQSTAKTAAQAQTA
jgi:hypothetical protein